MKIAETIPFVAFRSTVFLMAGIAGFSDVFGFISANHLFTSHITGNIVIAISEIMSHEPGVASKIISIPLFILIVVCVAAWVGIKGISKKTLAIWFFIEAFFLGLFMIAGKLILENGKVGSYSYIVGALFAVCAMSIHNAILRIFMSSFPPCTVMTGNFTQLIINSFDYCLGYKESHAIEHRRAAKQGIARFGNAILGFVIGGGFAVLGYTLCGFWALWLPILLLLYMIGILKAKA